MRIWFDTEFMEDGKTIDLVSLGAVREDGATLYLESAEADLSRANAFVCAQVIPRLEGPRVARAEIADRVIAFAGNEPDWWAYYGAYDWVALCQLFGTMGQLPRSWPMYCRDLQQWADELGVDLYAEVPMPADAHHALADAQWNRKAWLYLSASSSSRA